MGLSHAQELWAGMWTRCEALHSEAGLYEAKALLKRLQWSFLFPRKVFILLSREFSWGF